MAKTASITVRLEPDIKSMAEKIYSDFGITISDAINIFLHKSVQIGGLPFSMRQPRYNAATMAAMQEAEDVSTGKIPAKTIILPESFLMNLMQRMTEYHATT